MIVRYIFLWNYSHRKIKIIRILSLWIQDQTKEKSSDGILGTSVQQKYQKCYMNIAGFYKGSNCQSRELVIFRAWGVYGTWHQNMKCVGQDTCISEGRVDQSRCNGVRLLLKKTCFVSRRWLFGCLRNGDSCLYAPADPGEVDSPSSFWLPKTKIWDDSRALCAQKKK